MFVLPPNDAGERGTEAQCEAALAAADELFQRNDAELRELTALGKQVRSAARPP